MDMLRSPLTLEDSSPIVEAAATVLKAYDMAALDPKVVLPSYMHAAILVLRKAMEPK